MPKPSRRSRKAEEVKKRDDMKKQEDGRQE